MFWGVTLESGKRYSQKVTESYHLSMACLETLQGDTQPVKKEVSVMIEHGHSDYVLCILEYGRVMQVNLDIIFDSGEVVTYFLNGEGTVHLTGYALAETENGNVALDKSDDAFALALDDEEDEDWTPSKEVKCSDSDDESDSEEEDVESEPEQEKNVAKKKEMEENELSGTNEDTDDDQGRQSSANVKGKKSKKRKISDPSPTQNGSANGGNLKFKKQRKMEVNHVNAEDSEDENISAEDESEDDSDEASEDDESSLDYSSEEEQKISSAGRTPMPKNTVNSANSLGGSPDLQPTHKKSVQKQQKSKLNAANVSSTNKGTVPVTPRNARKLAGNIQVEDLRIGSGPTAKSGKCVFLHYVGKIENGKVFETCAAPKKPFTFRLGKGEVIRGLEIGVEGMAVGGKRKITIPPNMGYGSQKNEQIPANSTLIFTVELKAVN